MSNAFWIIKFITELNKLMSGWFGYTNRMEEQELVKSIYKRKSMIFCGRRDRPKIKGEDNVFGDLKMMKINNWVKIVVQHANELWRIVEKVETLDSEL